MELSISFEKWVGYLYTCGWKIINFVHDSINFPSEVCQNNSFGNFLLQGNNIFNVVGWLEDAAYFAAIDNSLNTLSWYDWPEPLKNRHLVALEDIYEQKRDFVRL